MAKILKRGSVPPLELAKWPCSTCSSVVLFEKSDVQSDQRDGDYVQCPVCHKFISVRLLKWRTDLP